MESRIPGQDGVARLKPHDDDASPFQHRYRSRHDQLRAGVRAAAWRSAVRDFWRPAMGLAVRNNGIHSASIISLPAGGSGRCPNSGRGGQERGMDCRPARTQKGRRIAWPGRPFREVLALSPHVRSLGAVSALGIGRHRSQPQNFTGTRLGAYPQPSQASLEQAVCRCRCRLRF